MQHIEAVWLLMNTNYSYYQRERDPEELAGLLDVWKQLLADLPPDVLKAAALQHIATSKWFPSVAELRQGVREIMYPARLSGIEAWGLVKREISRVGGYGKPHFEDEFVAAAVRTIGWMTICRSEMEASDRARFIDCYNALMSRAEKEATLLPQVREAIETAGHMLLKPPGNERR